MKTSSLGADVIAYDNNKFGVYFLNMKNYQLQYYHAPLQLSVFLNDAIFSRVIPESAESRVHKC